MTVIVAIAKDKKCVMVGDSATSDGKYAVPMLYPKVHRVDNYLIGYAGSIGVPQLIMNHFPFPDLPRSGHDAFMLSTFMPHLSTFLKINEIFPKSEDDVELLVATKERVYAIAFDGYDQQCLPFNEYAIGSGGGIAMGSLYTSSSWSSIEKRAKIAAKAATTYVMGCQEPLTTLTIP